MARRRVDHHPRRFVDREHVLVLIDYLEWQVLSGNTQLRRGAEPHLEARPAGQLRALLDALPIHRYAPLGAQLTEVAPAQRREQHRERRVHSHTVHVLARPQLLHLDIVVLILLRLRPARRHQCIANGGCGSAG